MMSGVQWYDRSASHELDGSVGDAALRTLHEDENTQGRPMPAGLSRMLKNGADAALPLGVPIGFAIPGLADDGVVDGGQPPTLATLVASKPHVLLFSPAGSSALSASADVTPSDRRLASPADWIASGQSENADLRSIDTIQAVAARQSVSQAQEGVSPRAANQPFRAFRGMPAEESREPLGSAGGLALSAAVGVAKHDGLSGVAVGQAASSSGAAGGDAIFGAAQSEAADVGVRRSLPASLNAVPRNGNAALIALQGDGSGEGVGRRGASGVASVDSVPRRAPVGERSSAETSSIGSGEPPASSPMVDRAWSVSEQGQSGRSSGRQAGQAVNAGSTVALRGDVLMDGRKMGRIVAAGQTSAASLPGVSSSAVNLRAMPVFSGTSVPL